jgi:hypothetical protein
MFLAPATRQADAIGDPRGTLDAGVLVAPGRPAAMAPAALGALCAPRDAAVVGAVLGLGLCARGKARTALVVLWRQDGGEPPVGGMALPGARGLAWRLATRGIPAWAAGRVAFAGVPADASEAVAVAARAIAAADGAPTVLLLAGPRPPAFDDLLAAQDRVIVAVSAAAAEGVAELAAIDASRVGRATSILHVPSSAPARAIAAAGLTLPPAMRAGVAAALEGRDG